MNHSISYYHDTRREKADGTYPVKLRIYSSVESKTKLLPTVFDLTPEQFQNAWVGKRVKKENKELNKQLIALFNKANETAGSLPVFSFDGFEKGLFRKKGDGVKLSYHYQNRIEELRERDQIGTAEVYELSEKSIIDFWENYKNRKYSNLTFFGITPKWLEGFEYYMTTVKGRSLTTVSMYLRSLRALFNAAIQAKEMDSEYYPFGKGLYQVPGVKKVKKALSQEELKTLFHAEPETPEQQKAKSFWFFSYACNGMNIKDIALLRWSNIDGDKIRFVREKTKRTTKQNQETITIYINEFIQQIIEQYGNPGTGSHGLIFDIINPADTAERQHAVIKNFIRFVNQHIKKLAETNDLPEAISTYWARHSFATNAIRKGVSTAFIQESLGHSDLKTTQGYFAGFDDKTRKEFSENLMDL